MLATTLAPAIFAAYIQIFSGDYYVFKIKQGDRPTFSLLLKSLITAPSQRRGAFRDWLMYTLFFSLTLTALNLDILKTSLFSPSELFFWLCALCLSAKIDFHTKLLPNAITYPLWITGALLHIYNATDPWHIFIIPSLAFYLLGLFINLISVKILKYSMVGLGDIKLLSVVICWMGSSFMVISLLQACLLFLITQPFKKVRPALQPFGPFIVIGVFGTLLLPSLSSLLY